jgi:hypothetical protein
MRIFLSTILFLLAMYIEAQENIMHCGRLVGNGGAPVEYATIGVPVCGKGTLSGIDGSFSLLLPSGCRDTVVISHVSYKELKIPADRLRATASPITMQPKELDELIVYDGKKKKTRLAGKGARIPGAVATFTTESLGHEIGTVVEVKRVFEVHEFAFNVHSSNMGSARVSMNIYKTDETGMAFTNELHAPVYVDIPASEGKQVIIVVPEKPLLIEPGIYFVSLMLVDCACSVDVANAAIHFPLYMKKSYMRKGIGCGLEKVPVNMGLEVRGIEYR